METNENVILLDDTIVAHVEEDKIIVKRFSNTYTFEYRATNELLQMDEVLSEFKGKRACIVSSDVTGVLNQKMKLKNLEKHVLVRIANKVIKEYLSYLLTIAKEENTGILIQTKYDNENPSVLITVGLLDDIQVVLLEVHYERNERRI